MRNSGHSRWPAVSLSALIVLGGGCGDLTSDARRAPAQRESCEPFPAWDTWNAWRTRAALPALTCSPALVAMAQKRRAYLLANGYPEGNPHLEKPDRPGYSGETLGERGAAFDVLDHEHWLHEGLVFGPGSEQMVQTFLDSVYHRGLVLAPGMTRLGAAHAGSVAVALVKEAAEPTSDQVVHYPLANQTSIRTTFDSDSEWPDAAPQAGVVGYPLSIFFPRRFSGPKVDVVVVSATLRSKTQANVPLTILHHGNDPKVQPGALHLIPTGSLLPDTDYTVQVEATYGDRQWDGGWTFRTLTLDEDDTHAGTQR